MMMMYDMNVEVLKEALGLFQEGLASELGLWIWLGDRGSWRNRLYLQLLLFKGILHVVVVVAVVLHKYWIGCLTLVANMGLP